MGNYSSIVSTATQTASDAQNLSNTAQSIANDAISFGTEVGNLASSVSDAVEACFGLSFKSSLNYNVGDIFGFIPSIDIPEYLLSNPLVKAIVSFVKTIYNTIMKYYQKLQSIISNVIGLIEKQYNYLMAWINQKKQDILKNPCVAKTIGPVLQQEFAKYQVPSLQSYINIQST